MGAEPAAVAGTEHPASGLLKPATTGPQAAALASCSMFIPWAGCPHAPRCHQLAWERGPPLLTPSLEAPWEDGAEALQDSGLVQALGFSPQHLETFSRAPPYPLRSRALS